MRAGWRAARLACGLGLTASLLVPAVAPSAASARVASASVAVAPPAGGMWLLGSDGGVFALAGAPFKGSLANTRLNAPVASLAATPSGHGYWIVASDGGIFTFGDARFYGSTGAIRLNRPIVGMTRTRSDRGYWLVASDGGVFTFGDAHFYGSAGGQHLTGSTVGIARTPGGDGYWIMTQTGQVFAFGAAARYGNTPSGSQVAGLVPTSTGNGYWVVTRDGQIRATGAAGPFASVRPAAPIVSISTRWASSGTSASLRSGTATGQPGPLQAALTFDDGPNATYTPQILAELAAYGVPATFFTVGYEGAARPDLLRAESAAGNSVEDHTWDHADLTKLPASNVAGELGNTAQLIEQATGIRPSCFRPPYGATSSTVVSIAAGLGLTQMLWNVDPRDWSRPGVGSIVNNVLSNSHGQGVVIIMHDGGGDRSQTVAALPQIITGLRSRGYQFVLPCV